MTWTFAESHVEKAALAWLTELGYATATGIDIGPDGSMPERANYADVLLLNRVRAAVDRLNPALPAGIHPQQRSQRRAISFMTNAPHGGRRAS